MAVWRIVFIVTLSVAVTLASSDVKDPHEECPSGNPLCHVWQPCDYTGSVQISCRDCETRVICTPLGGWVFPCWEPGHHNCVDGSCVRDPGPGCAEEPTTPENETTAPEYETNATY